MLCTCRQLRLLCGVALTSASLLSGCATTVVGHGGIDPQSLRPSLPLTVESSQTPFDAQDHEGLDDFCDWYDRDLEQSMDTISAFLAAFGTGGGDYNDPDVQGPAQEAEHAAGEAADALNGFLADFPAEVTERARLAVTGLRDTVSALALAVRDQKGPEEINAKVAAFDEAYKALRPVCQQ